MTAITTNILTGRQLLSTRQQYHRVVDEVPDSACSGRDKTCKNYKRGTKNNHSRKGNLDRIAVEYVYQGDEISLKITKTPTKTNSIIKLIK